MVINLKKVVLMRVLLLCAVVVTFFSTIKPVSFELLDPGYDKKKIKVLEQIRGGKKKSVVTFIVDGKKNLFLIKQTTRPNPARELLAVRDMLAASIAESHDIPANRIRIIPKKLQIPGKVQPNVSATLHNLVPGAPLPQSSAFYIGQPMKHYIPKERWGLKLRAIRDMALHTDLPKIVALDTFVGNDARWRTSCFYDDKQDRFFAIDLESSFHKPIAQFACECIRDLLKDKKIILTAQEISGLILYRDTLKEMVKKHPPQVQHDMLQAFVSESGINHTNSRVIKAMKLYKSTINANYKSSRELVKLLGDLITYHEKNGQYTLTQKIFNPMKQEPCICFGCQSSCALYDALRNYSKDKQEYIIDRIRVYKHIYS